MDNKKLPISKVPSFADEALRLGCYTKNQRYNFETAWAILTKSLAEAGLNVENTVEQLQPKVEVLLDGHGRKSSVSAASIRAYAARVKKLLDDFVKHNGGDYMAWKKELDKTSGTEDTKPKRRRKRASLRPANGETEEEMGTIAHRLIAGGQKEGKISLPDDLTDEEVDRVWAQLDALKALFKAQSAALTGKPAKAPNSQEKQC